MTRNFSETLHDVRALAGEPAEPVLDESARRRQLRRMARGPEAPVVLDPRTGKPRTFDVAECPVGTVRVRQDGGNRARRVRYVKVRMDGPQSRRWRPYARWWWETHRGPVPPGKVVIHVDGDALNDDPSNLAVGTLDDALFIAHQGRPGRNDSALRRERVREFNHARSAVRRLRGPLAGRWYLVDLELRRIRNVAARTRWAALDAAGVLAPAGRANGRGWAGALLGWPGRGDAGAALLAAIVAAGRPLTGPEWRALAAAELARVGASAPAWDSTWNSVAWRLKAEGLVTVQRRGCRPSIVRATAAATAARGPWSPLVPVRADRLAEYAGFEWVAANGKAYQREAGNGRAHVLAALVKGGTS